MLASKENIIPVLLDNTATDWRARLFLDYLKEKGLDVIPQNPRDVADYASWLEGKDYKHNSILVILKYVRELYRTAGIETKNIFKGPRNSTNFFRNPVLEEDIRKLLKYVNEKCSLRDQLILKIMVYQGLRDAEISHMDVGDFYKHEDGYFVKLWRKGYTGKDRQDKVVNYVLATFLEYHMWRLSTNCRHNKGKNCQPDDPLFISQKGCRMRPDTISHLVSLIMKKAGVKAETNDNRISAHSLRHTAITPTANKPGNFMLTKKCAAYEDMRIVDIYHTYNQNK